MRPKWVRAINDFVTDEVLDEKYEFPLDGSDDELHDRVETAVRAVFCDHYGHEIEDDQCGIPSHRYCVYCLRGITDIEEES
jgi:peptide methionine sulfoxide reductase MsrB